MPEFVPSDSHSKPLDKGRNKYTTAMKSVRRTSVVEQFQASQTTIPDVPTGGARIKVHYAGACYTERQFQKGARRRAKLAGIQDTSLYPGYEISGVVDAVCNTVSANSRVKVGSRVIIYPEDHEETKEGYDEYVIVSDIENVIPIPDTLSLQVAAMLPSGALTAMGTVNKLSPILLDRIAKKKDTRPINILIVGAGALGLWTVILGRTLFPQHRDKVHTLVSDTNIEKLMVAKEHGCTDVLHWNESIHEEYLIERTKNQCPGGVDVIIDYSSSPRTIQRSMKVLADEGVLVVGGNAKYEVSFCLHTIARKQQSILGVSKGTREQLEELVDMVATEKITPPKYQIFPVDEANKVFDQLNAYKITGRAVLEVCPVDSDDLA